MSIKEGVGNDGKEGRSFENNSYLTAAKQRVREHFGLGSETTELELRGYPDFASYWEETFGATGYLRNYPDVEDAKRFIATAYVLAEYGHQYQNRKQYNESGHPIPYITHPIGVARDFCVKLRQNPTVAAGALLHDVIEDSGNHGHPVSYDDIRSLLGASITNPTEEIAPERVERMVLGLSKVRADTKDQEFMVTANNMIHLSWDDPAIIGLKIYDRLYNMRTIQFLKPEVQYRKALETVYIYGPLAKRAGLYEEYHELMDRSYSVIDAIDHQGQNEKMIHGVLSAMSEHMNPHMYERILHAPLEEQITSLSVSIPHFHEVYRRFLKQRKHSETGEASPYEFFINVLITMPDDEPYDKKSFAKKRSDILTSLYMDVPEMTKPPDDHLGFADLLEGVDHKEFDRPYYLYLRYKDLPLRIKVFQQSTFDRYRTSLGILTAVAPTTNGDTQANFERDRQFAIANQAYIQQQYLRLGSQPMSKEAWMQEFGIVLAREMTVQLIQATKEPQSIDLAQAATVMDLLLIHGGDDWKRVARVLVNGKEVPLHTELKRNQRVEIQVADSVTVHPSWIGAVDKSAYSIEKLFRALREQCDQLQQDGSVQEILDFQEALEIAGWELLTEPLTEVEESFKFERIIPFLSHPEHFSVDTFLMDVGLGSVEQEQIEDVRQAIKNYWNSLLQVTIWVTDRSGIIREIMSTFQAENGTPFDLVHTEEKRKRAADQVRLTYYFDPQDPHFDEVLPRLSDVRTIQNVLSVTY